MPNGKKQKQSYISKRREQKNVKPEGLKSTEIVGENINLSLNKKIYGNNAMIQTWRMENHLPNLLII